MDIFKNIVVTEISGLLTVASPKGRHEKIIDRKSYGISFCYDGQLIYTHNGKNYVSDKNHAIILPKGQSYMLYGNKKGIFPVINFDCNDFLCDTHTVIQIKDVNPYLSDYEQMKSLSIFEKNRAKVMSIFYNIIHRLSSEFDSTPEILTPAINYLEKNYSDCSLTNSMLAKLCNISEVYFRRLFTEYFQKTPRQFIIDIRINKAKQMLADANLKINAVSEKCGFSNPYHFCRVFKQKTGLTPTEYSIKNRIYKI